MGVTIKVLIYYSIVLLLIISSSGRDLPGISEKVSASQQEIINPHWTGKDCELCHEERPEPGQKDLKFKFGGDYVAMCNSCHQSEYARTDLHPVGVFPREGDQISIPAWLPLQEGKTTCITCHEMKLHIEKNPPIQFKNPEFLRRGPYKNKIELCFHCHKVKTYQKVNPHEQIDEKGEILKVKCLYCHQSLPDPDSALAIKEVTFKSQIGTFCTACHPQEEYNHPAWVNHMLSPSQGMIRDIESSEKSFEVILPLFKGSVFCGTCHNPHAPGVIKRTVASKGAGEKHRLRLKADYELCISCHAEKEGLLTKEIGIEIQEDQLEIPAASEKTHTSHQAYLEKKCRACHSITKENPNRPRVYKLCFQTECHNPDLIGGNFVHSLPVQGDCLFCHNQHESQYGYHIVNDQQKLCKACHTLLMGEKKGESNQKGEDFHNQYLNMFKKVVHHQEPSCIFCHGRDHREMVKERGIKPCYRCHNYIKQLVKGRKEKRVNVHDNFRKKRCTECHNPHSSPYPELLKEKPEVYLKGS